MHKALIGKKILLAVLLLAAVASAAIFWRQAGAANPPALKEGTYLQGQSLSVWPSWTVLGNALGMSLPTDPINLLGRAGTCATTTNRFCLEDGQCPNGERCVIHDAATGWSTEDRRFSFACATTSYAYRYVDISTSTYELRARLEDLGVTPNNWDAFVGSFVSSSVVKFYPTGICSGDQEISSLSVGRCGDGVVNVVNMEQCDPPGRTRYGACGAESGHANEVKVDVCNAACKWIASSTPFINCSVLSKCGNGMIEPGETCDDGRLNGKYNHCNTACNGKSATYCGDGIVQTANELCDPGISGDKYAFNRKDSCAWDCQHYGRYCGDRIVEEQPDEIPGALGTSTGGFFNITSKLGKAVQVMEQNTADWCNNDSGGRVSCNNNTWNYSIYFSQSATYTIQAVTANANQDLSNSTSSDYLCDSIPGIQHHLTFSLDGIPLGSYCANAVPTPQAGTKYVFHASAGIHIISLKWDNDVYAPPVDSNLKVIKLNLIKNIEECDGNQACTTNSRQGTVFCTSQCTFAYPPDPQDGYCSTTKPAAVAPPGTCGDGVVDPNEVCDKGLAHNGEACTPAYNKTCAYCSADCKNTVDVQPTQYCGNGIVEGPEECDQDRGTGVIYRTRESLCSGRRTIICLAESFILSGSSWDSAHNGLRVRTCAEDTPSDYYGFWKGTRECTSCKLVDNCVACGYDPEKGVEVKEAKMINVLEPTSGNPLYGLPVTVPAEDASGNVLCPGTSQHLPLWQCPENSSLRDPKIHLLMAPTNTANPASGAYSGGKAWRVPFANSYYLASAPGDTNGRYSNTPTKVSANAICSVGSPQYKLQFNEDPKPAHWQPFTIIEDKFNDKPWKYDLVLSPMIAKSAIGDLGRKQDVRIVMSWVGGSEFYGGFLMPMSRTDRSQDVLIEGPTFGSNISTGRGYYNNNPFHGIWYHSLGFTTNQMNEEAFTVDISKMEAGLYVFYVRSASGPLSQLRSSAKLRVDVYLPETVLPSDFYTGGYVERSFSQPAQTFYLATAIPSDNQQASYLQVFNLLAVGEQASTTNIMDVNAVATDPKYFTFTASCVGRAGKICRASWGACDVPEYCTADSDVCPEDTFKPATESCISGNPGSCYSGARCSGMSPDCLEPLYKPAGATCGAADECNNPPTCEGNSFDCPNNSTPQPQGTPCGDSCQGYHCSHGSCIAGTPIDCSSSNPCKNPTCDPQVGGCTYKEIGTPCAANSTCQFHLGGGDQVMCKCTPKTSADCAAAGAQCGTIPDGCGGTVTCGMNGNCMLPINAICQNNQCVCAANQLQCGLRCSTCPAPQTCKVRACVGGTGYELPLCQNVNAPDGTYCGPYRYCQAGICKSGLPPL